MFKYVITKLKYHLKRLLTESLNLKKGVVQRTRNYNFIYLYKSSFTEIHNSISVRLITLVFEKKSLLSMNKKDLSERGICTKFMNPVK